MSYPRIEGPWHIEISFGEVMNEAPPQGILRSRVRPEVLALLDLHDVLYVSVASADSRDLVTYTKVPDRP